MRPSSFRWIAIDTVKGLDLSRICLIAGFRFLSGVLGICDSGRERPSRSRPASSQYTEKIPAVDFGFVIGHRISSWCGSS
jgi:hypothetical protein